MCRFVLYLGQAVPIARLTTEPTHSLLHQSRDAYEGRERVNGDGFGLSWYAPEGDQVPAVFRSTRPAWNDPNFSDLSRVVRSRCFMAHVRAAAVGLGVSVHNCHPFRDGRHIFMHNGNIDGFGAIRRALFARLSRPAFERIRGTTDSEHVFGLFTDRLLQTPAGDPAGRLAEALASTVAEVCELVDEHAPGAEVTLNLAVADGENVAVTRFGNPAAAGGKSLYLLRTGDESVPALVIASERLDDDPRWEPVPDGSVVTASLGHPARITRLISSPLRSSPV